MTALISALAAVPAAAFLNASPAVPETAVPQNFAAALLAFRGDTLPAPVAPVPQEQAEAPSAPPVPVLTVPGASTAELAELRSDLGEAVAGLSDGFAEVVSLPMTASEATDTATAFLRLLRAFDSRHGANTVEVVSAALEALPEGVPVPETPEALVAAMAAPLRLGLRVPLSVQPESGPAVPMTLTALVEGAEVRLSPIPVVEAAPVTETAPAQAEATNPATPRRAADGERPVIATRTAAPLDQLRDLDISALRKNGKMVVELAPRGIGTLEISVETGRNGALRVLVRCDNPVTLDALRQDREALAGVLNDRGMGGAELSFSSHGGRDQAPGPSTPVLAAVSDDLAEPEAEAQPAPVSVRTGVDIIA